MADRKITVRLEPAFMAEHPLVQMGTSMLNSEVHGPLRFSPLGVACGPLDNPAFVPWAQVSGVQGWEPPEPRAQQPVDADQSKGKFKPQ